MLILSPMLVSVEHHFMTNFKLYWKCRKITSSSDRQNKAGPWLSKGSEYACFKRLYKEIR